MSPRMFDSGKSMNFESLWVEFFQKAFAKNIWKLAAMLPMFSLFEKWSWVGLYGVRMLLMCYMSVAHAFSCFFSLQNFLISSQLPTKKTKPRKKRKGKVKWTI
jgi:hypothetical protein